MTAPPKPPPPPSTPPSELDPTEPPVEDVDVSNYYGQGIIARNSVSRWTTADSDPDFFVGETTGDMYIDAASHLQLESNEHKHNVSGVVGQYFKRVDRKVVNNEMVLIAGNNKIHCNLSQVVSIAGHHKLTTSASQTTVVGGGQEIIVKNGGKVVNVTGNLSEKITGDHKTTVTGSETVVIGGKKKLISNNSWDWKILGPVIAFKGSTENALTGSAKLALAYSAEASVTIGASEKASASIDIERVSGKKSVTTFGSAIVRSYGPTRELTPSKKEKSSVKSSIKAKVGKIKTGLCKIESSLINKNNSSDETK